MGAYAGNSANEQVSTADGGSASPSPGGRPRVVVVGAGFGGMAAARTLSAPWRRHRVRATLVDRHNHHTFTPFLYQVATALLEPSGAARPIRSAIRKFANVEFRLATVTGVDVTRHVVRTDRGEIGYDYLICAAGAVNDFHHHTSIAQHCLGLDDLSAALALRNHLLGRFEAAIWAQGPRERKRLLTFAVVGGGPTGVEFAAALAALIRQLAAREFPGISAADTRILLIEASAAPLPSFGPDLQKTALDGLRSCGVEVLSGVSADGADCGGLTLNDGRRVEAATVVWAAGVRASPLAGIFPATGSHDRVIVHPSLQIERHPDIFVVGDMAEIPADAGPCRWWRRWRSSPGGMLPVQFCACAAAAR